MLNRKSQTMVSPSLSVRGPPPKSESALSPSFSIPRPAPSSPSYSKLLSSTRRSLPPTPPPTPSSTTASSSSSPSKPLFTFEHAARTVEVENRLHTIEDEMGDSNDDNGVGDGGDVDSKSNGDGANKKHGYHSFAGINGCPADVVRDDGQHGFVDHLMFDSSNLMVGEEVSAGTRRQHSHSSNRCDDDDHTAPSHRLDSKRHTDLYRDDDTDSDNEDGGEDDSDANTDAGNMVMGPHSSCGHSTAKSTHSMPTVTISYLVTRLIRLKHENRGATNEMASMRHQANGWNQEKERLLHTLDTLEDANAILKERLNCYIDMAASASVPSSSLSSSSSVSSSSASSTVSTTSSSNLCESDSTTAAETNKLCDAEENMLAMRESYHRSCQLLEDDLLTRQLELVNLKRELELSQHQMMEMKESKRLDEMATREVKRSLESWIEELELSLTTYRHRIDELEHRFDEKTQECDRWKSQCFVPFTLTSAQADNRAVCKVNDELVNCSLLGSERPSHSDSGRLSPLSLLNYVIGRNDEHLIENQRLTPQLEMEDHTNNMSLSTNQRDGKEETKTCVTQSDSLSIHHSHGSSSFLSSSSS